MAHTTIGRFMEFRPSWQSFGVWYFGIFLFLVGPLVNPDTFISEAAGQLIASLLAAYVIVTRFTRIYRVSQDTVEVERSFPSHLKQTAPIVNITRVDLRRGIAQRVMNVAHVHLHVKSPEGEQVLRLSGVPSPDRFRRVLLDRGAGDERVYGAFRS
ncbi:MAG: PH domain-containing protein [Desulfarculaceae bacterium]|nr:PH domain-containing protein [Desulfarculaceae bacterium]MCF8072538.1 PH domain-containing protein [Desulfarculaceae bacterium]MCF8103441.1 PH domain-containing protein [Desulfarculaceae bacterium]MCF8117079.1 PH domain-containing protein [Desulfarculaceae bacterium]